MSAGGDLVAAVRTQLAPLGVLRAGINLGNTLLVTSREPDGAPRGVSPDIASEIAARLGVAVQFVPYADPGALADAAQHGAWDIGNIGAEPQRARTIAFSAAYAEIEASYLVPAGSPIASLDQVDRPGVRIATKGLAAYGLWLENNLRHATLVRTDSIDSAFDVFVAERLEALAGLRTRLLADAARLPGACVLDGRFSAVQQAVGTPRRNDAAAVWLAQVVEELKASGFVADSIARHGVCGLTVAAAA